MTIGDKRRIMAAIILVGAISITIVVMSAFAAELRRDNNRLINENEELSGEVETISVKIKSKNSIDHIEKVAKKELGMVYPTSEQMVQVTEKDSPGANFASTIKKQAYN